MSLKIFYLKLLQSDAKKKTLSIGNFDPKQDNCNCFTKFSTSGIVAILYIREKNAI